jgi:hypothetical protein
LFRFVLYIKEEFLEYSESPALYLDNTTAVVGVDPGVSTGFAACTPQGDLIYGSVFVGLRELAGALRTLHPGTVVMEDFLGSRGWVMYKRPLAVIGAVMLVCEEEEIRLVLQSPAILQSKRLQGRVRGISSPHIRSAYIHVLHFLHL